jgi:hypothetical protein
LKEARTIEQGMGRAVRGQRDYCVVIIIGPSLVRAMRAGHSKQNFSEMTHKQIEIGLTVSGMVREEVAEGVDSLIALDRLIRQSLDRDEGWKNFYTQEMDTLQVRVTSPILLDLFAAELQAELLYQEGTPEAAIDKLQKLIDKFVSPDDREDRGWYLQEMARYKYSINATDANSLQIQAHKLNRALMRPKTGMVVEKLIVSQMRIENVKAWLGQYGGNNEALMLAVDEICSDLTFGKYADGFEEALHNMGLALGFACQRPDKEWREGPDNLWGLREGQFLLFECKSEVEQGRETIYKNETGQMNNSCGWFKREYQGATAKKIMIIPAKKLGAGAAFNDPVEIMRRNKLKALVRSFRGFFQELKQLDLGSISDSRIQQALAEHNLDIENLLNDYSEAPVPA